MPDGPAAPYLTVAPSARPLPLVLSSPHSGRCYPAELVAQSRLSRDQLRVLDDGPVDALLARACACGATMIAATYPRAMVDLNRDQLEQDPDTLADPDAISGLRATLKARAGLGVVPTRLLGEAIYARKLAAAELRQRIERAYRPYHDLLAGLAAEQRRRFGAALVLDCHSMPTLPPMTRGEAPIDVALGDRFGRSCHPRLVEVAERALAGAGLRVARNRPYAGGHITERHGRPGRGSHALQLEFRRSLFMDEHSHVPHDGLVALQDLLRELVEALGAALLALPRPTIGATERRDRALRSA
ncbi:MAG: N-formylglutamate amidohydrolase [Geminicoccaceae bacterium]